MQKYKSSIKNWNKIFSKKEGDIFLLIILYIILIIKEIDIKIKEKRELGGKIGYISSNLKWAEGKLVVYIPP